MNQSFYIPGIMCSACTTTIESALREALPDTTINSNPLEKTITLNSNDAVSFEQLTSVLEAIGFDEGVIDISQVPPPPPATQFVKEQQRKAKLNDHLHKLWLTGPLAIMLLLISAFGVTLPVWLSLSTAVISAALTIYAGKQFFLTAYQKLKKRQLVMDSLFSLSSLTALTVSLASLFVPALPFQFATVLMVIATRHLGLYIEQRLIHHIMPASFLSRLPQTVYLSHHGTPQRVASNTIAIGDEVIIYPGGVIPFDGTVVAGNALISRTLINGRLQPTAAKHKEHLASGQRVNSGVLRLKVTALQAASYSAKLDTHMQQINQTNSRVSRLSQTIMPYFIPGVFVLSALSGLVMMQVMNPISGLHAALSMLVAACPCTLGLIIPLAMKVATNRLAERGISVQHSAALEQACDISHIVFDIHGTLTASDFAVSATKPCTTAHYAIVKAMEEASLNTRPHPIGASLLAHANKQGVEKLTTPCLLDEAANQPGIIATIAGVRYYLGNHALMAQCNISVPKSTPGAVYLATDSAVLAQWTVRAPLRPEASSIIKDLKAKGKSVYLCSGADEETAHYYASQLGIHERHVIANCHGGEQKRLRLIAAGLTLKHTAMVGDGSNDALMLRAAGLGIAVNQADTISRQLADIHLSQDNLLLLTPLFATAKQTMRIIKQNLALSLGYNLAAAFLSCLICCIAAPIAPPVMAGLMTAQALIVLANNTRLQTAPQDEPKKEANAAPSCQVVSKLSTVPEARPTSRPELNGESSPSVPTHAYHRA